MNSMGNGLAEASVRRLGVLLGVAALGSALLTGCGSDAPAVDFGAMADVAESQQEAADARQDAGANDSSSSEVKPIEFLLPETSDVPSGFREVPAKCETDSAASEYRGWYNFAVPEDWESGGVVGGSSAPLSEGTELSFGTGSDRSTVEAETDSMSPEGTLGDGQGGEWTTFDYDFTSGDMAGTVEFEEVGTVAIAAQDVTILAAPYQQDPEFLNVTEYKARINVATVYGRFLETDRAYTSSIVVTIKPTHADQELAPDVVGNMVGSFAMPQCARDRVVVEEELRVKKDLDGDGEVATIEDYRRLSSQE